MLPNSPLTDDNDFTVTVDGEEVQLTLGSYILMPDNKQHTVTATDVAGNTTSVTVTVNMLYKVTLSSGAGYTLSGDPLVGHGQEYTFTLEIAKGYSKTENFMVDVNGAPMHSDSGSYTVSPVDERYCHHRFRRCGYYSAGSGDHCKHEQIQFLHEHDHLRPVL